MFHFDPNHLPHYPSLIMEVLIQGFFLPSPGVEKGNKEPQPKPIVHFYRNLHLIK